MTRSYADIHRQLTFVHVNLESNIFENILKNMAHDKRKDFVYTRQAPYH